jgi:PKD repeat protein
VTGSGGTPTANFTFSANGLTVAFTDTSTDAGGTIGSHAWTFGDGGTSTAANPTHTYAAGGTYSVTETVTDSGNGTTSSKTSAVTVSASGGTPVANFTYTASGLTVNFTDTSTDSGGSIGQHSWNFGDGGTSSAANPSHTYASAGTYSVSETVTDSVNNRSSTKTVSITVSVSTSSQLIVNGGFETGMASPWSLTAGVLCSNSSCPGETAHSGSWFAWLDGYGFTHTDTATQTVAIPAGKTTATLAFYLHIDTQETGTIAYDTLKVQVLNSSGSVLATLATYSNVNAASGYSLKSLNMNAYIGQTVQIHFVGHEDSSLATSFVLDDITLTVQ